MKYLQGETIHVTIEGEEIKQQQIDFSLWLYRYSNNPVIMPKNSMTVVGESYTCVIPSTVTAKMDVGVYYLELVGVNREVIIAKSEAFEIEKSISKGKLNEN